MTWTGVLLLRCSDAKVRRQSSSDGVDADDAGVSGALQQVGRSGQWRLFVDVAPVAGRYRGGAVEGAHVADDFGDDAAELVADRDDPGPVELGRFDMQQVVDTSVAELPFEDVEGGQLACLLHS